MYVVGGKTLYDAVRAYTKVDIFDAYHDKVKSHNGSVDWLSNGYGNVRPRYVIQIRFEHKGLPSDTHVVMYVVGGKTLYDAVRAYTKVDIFDATTIK